MAGKSFLKGAFILSIAGVLGKLLGALYRIPFARMVGEEGSAIYGLVYPLYNLLLALSTAGIPLAISKLIAEREERGESGTSLRIFKLSLLVLASIGICVAVVVFLNAQWIAANVLNEPKAAWSLRAIAPAMVFSCVQAVFRGYFQGLQQMVPTAISQVTEQFVRVGVIMIAIFTLLPYGAEIVAAGASLGASVGGLTALMVIMSIFLRYRQKHKSLLPAGGMGGVETGGARHGKILIESNGSIIRQVLILAIPISIGSLVLPLMQSLDSVLVLPRLEFGGFSHQEAMAQFAYLATYVAPIINLPFILTTAVAASLVPAISEAVAAGRQAELQKVFTSAMQLAIVIVLPAALGLMTLAAPICTLLYAQEAAGVAMFWSAPIVLVVGLYQISAGTLQGMGKAMIPMYSLFIGAAIKAVFTYFLTAVPAIGIRGAAIGTVIGFSVAVLHNIWHVSRGIGWQWFQPKKHIVKPFISVFAMSVLVIIGYQGLFAITQSNGFATLCAIVLGGMVYFIVLLAVGGIQVEDIQKVPKWGDRLAALFIKLKLVRDL